MAQLLKMQAHIRGIDQSKKDETAQNLRVMLDNIPTEPDMTQRNDAQDILSAACAAKTVSDVKDKEDKDLGKFLHVYHEMMCRVYFLLSVSLSEILKRCMHESLLSFRDANLRIFVVKRRGPTNLSNWNRPSSIIREIKKCACPF